MQTQKKLLHLVLVCVLEILKLPKRKRLILLVELVGKSTHYNICLNVYKFASILLNFVLSTFKNWNSVFTNKKLSVDFVA